MNIDYPDLDDEPKKPPDEVPARPVVNRTTKPPTDVPADIPTVVDNSSKTESVKVPVTNGVAPESRTPVVDRQSKNKAVAHYLKAEEEAMEKSLQMAKKALEQENEWDKLRSMKEIEANIEMKNTLQQREEELIQRLKKFENDYREQVSSLSNFWKNEFMESFI